MKMRSASPADPKARPAFKAKKVPAITSARTDAKNCLRPSVYETSSIPTGHEMKTTGEIMEWTKPWVVIIELPSMSVGKKPNTNNAAPARKTSSAPALYFAENVWFFPRAIASDMFPIPPAKNPDIIKAEYGPTA